MTEPKSGSDGGLLQRLKAGDPRAWEEFVAAHSEWLYNYLRHNLPNAEDVQDVVGETFLAAVKAVQTFDGQASLKTLLYALADRKMADFWRKRPVTSELPETVPIEGISTKQLEFYEALNKLSETSRKVLLLRYREGLSVPEIATVIDRTYKATESLLSRAREELRKWLSEDDDTDTSSS